VLGVFNQICLLSMHSFVSQVLRKQAVIVPFYFLTAVKDDYPLYPDMKKPKDMSKAYLSEVFKKRIYSIDRLSVRTGFAAAFMHYMKVGAIGKVSLDKNDGLLGVFSLIPVDEDKKTHLLHISGLQVFTKQRNNHNVQTTCHP
jgi:hypothetical protein